MAITLPEHEHACVEKLRQARAGLQPRQFIPRPTRVVSLIVFIEGSRAASGQCLFTWEHYY